MPPPRVPAGGRLSLRRFGVVALLALGCVAVYGAANLGNLLHVEQPLVHADAAVVLGGSRLERPLEAADLYREGWVARIVLSRQPLDGGEAALAARGVPFASETDVQRRALVATGVPDDRIEVLPRTASSTADEATMIAALAAARGWSRVIVVTSIFHTARASLVVRRRLAGTGIDVLVRSTRYDASDPAHWWRSRGDLKVVPFEAQRYLLYWLGIAD
ncbi:MAG: YdcF family protein [Vicinamibacterales bacterium]